MSGKALGLDLERAAALLLRTGHLLAVVWLGAALLGAPAAPGPAALAMLGTGVVLAALDLRARRLVWNELAGWVVWGKLGAAAWMALVPGHALPAFVAVVVVSSLAAHAPKALRHWPARPSGPERAGR